MRLPSLVLLPILAGTVIAGKVPPVPFVITQWQTEQGLPENSATAMTQTPDGYLWFGTFNGLVRFDGLKFTVFNTSNTPELPHDGIINVYSDRSANLWVSTLGGLTRFAGGTWTRYGPSQGFTGDYIRFIAEHAVGGLAMTTFNGKVFKWDGRRFIDLGRPPSPPAATVGSPFVGFDQKGNLEVAIGPTLTRWVGGQWQPVALPAKLDVASAAQWVWTQHRGRCILPGSGARRLSCWRDGEAPRDYLVPGMGPFWANFEDPDGTLWFAANGAFRLGLDGQYVALTKENSFFSESLRFVFRDWEGNHWVGSNGRGMVRLRDLIVTSFRETDGLPPQRTTSAAYLGDGSILTASHGGGVSRIAGGVARPFGTKPSVSFRHVQALLLDRSGRLWTGAYGGLGVTGSRPLEVPAWLNSPTNVQALFEDQRGRIWIGTSQFVAYFDGSRFVRLPDQPHSGPDLVHHFAQDPATGDILVAGDGGLFRIADGLMTAVHTADGQPLPPLLSAMVDSGGQLWLGSSSKGLLHLRQGALTSIGTRHGLSPRMIATVLEVGPHFWMSSNDGVWRVRRDELLAAVEGVPTDLGWRKFGLAEGMPSTECAHWFQPSMGRDRQGEIWVATLKGLAIIDPRSVTDQAEPSPVGLEEVNYRDAAQNEVRIVLRGQQRVVLPAGSHSVRLTYTALHLTSPERVLFDYSLRRDDETIGSGQTTAREVTFHQLEPGKSIFTLRARNGFGAWNTEPLQIELERQPYWHETATYRYGGPAVVILLAAGGALLSFRRRLRRQQAALEKEREVSEVKARLALVLEKTNDSVRFATPEGTLLYVNRATREMLGLPPDLTVKGISVESLYPAWAWTVICETAIPYALEHGAWQGELAVLHRDGHEIPIWQSYYIHRGADGRPEFVSSISRDITEIRQAAAALQAAKENAERASRLKSEFLANMSHEIRTPMNGILGMTQLLLLGSLDPEQREFAETVQSSARSMLQLLNDILDLSRIEAGRLELRPRPFRLTDTVNEVSGLCVPNAKRKGLELRVHALAPTIPDVLVGDSLRVRQILLNFLDNAIKFTNAGFIDLAITESSRDAYSIRLRLAVTDTGCGIRAEDQLILFTKFTQVDASNTRRHGGAGLGLSIARQLAELMKGGVGVESTPGIGSTFWAELVFEVPPPSGVVPLLTDAPAELHGPAKRLLLAEDNPVNRKVVQAMLARLGCEVEIATTGKEALEKFATQAYDLVFMDVHMPAMDGLEATARIRAAEAAGSKRCPIIAITASNMPEDRDRCLAAGMDDLLAKPVDLQDLTVILRRFTRR